MRSDLIGTWVRVGLAFVLATAGAAAERELRQLAAIGSPRDYFARQAIAWAKARPADADAAEALARAVTAGRWTCSEWPLTQQALTLLHKQFPQTECARRTKYWHR